MKQKARLESEKQGLIEMRDRNRAEKEARQEEERQRANEIKERQAAEKSALNILKIEDQKIRNQKSALELKNAEGQTTGFQDQILPTQKRSLQDRVKDVQPETDRPTSLKLHYKNYKGRHKLAVRQGWQRRQDNSLKRPLRNV